MLYCGFAIGSLAPVVLEGDATLQGFNSGTIADGFADVTVMFADIIDFTRLSEELPPKAMVMTRAMAIQSCLMRDMVRLAIVIRYSWISGNQAITLHPLEEVAPA